MALIVEDGTGLADAESYLAVADLKAYADGRGYSYAAYTDPQLEAALRKATQFIDTIVRYKATRLLAAQALEFPRTGLTDWSGHAVEGIPLRVKHACAELAIKACAEELYQDAERGGQVQSESVGPISVTYAAGAPVEKLYTVAVNLLKQYIRNPRDLQGGPYVGGTVDVADATFSSGIHDSPGGAVSELESDA